MPTTASNPRFHLLSARLGAVPALRRGFSLPELLVTLGVVGLLLAILAPALGAARLRARELQCASRTRQLGGLVAMYAGEHDDLFPSALGDGPDVRDNRELWHDYIVQVFTTFAREPWQSWAGLHKWSEVLYCSENQDWPDYPLGNSDPDFILSLSVYAEHRMFDPRAPESFWRGRLGAKVQRHSAAVFPDRKVAVIEHRVWHGWSGASCPGCPIAGLEYVNSERPGFLWFVDGHVEQVHGTDALHYVDRKPIWPRMPFGSTAMGIAGRDIP
jgi:prepilin-type N-terminal cleavage/methylation domain-containing protein